MSGCLAIIPARGGSVGLPFKNLRKFHGVPLVRLAVEVAQQVPEITDFVVSTNRERIACAANTYNVIKRPEELSTGFVGDVAVLTHALLTHEKNLLDEGCYDEIVMLQPTSPLRLAADVSRAIQWRREGNWDAVWTVSPTDTKYHPLKQLVMDYQTQQLKHMDPKGSEIIARQQLAPTYTRNGVAYVLSRECLLGQKTTLGARSSAIIIDTPQISIDTLEDLQLAELIYEQQHRKQGEYADTDGLDKYQDTDAKAYT